VGEGQAKKTGGLEDLTSAKPHAYSGHVSRKALLSQHGAYAKATWERPEKNTEGEGMSLAEGCLSRK